MKARTPKFTKAICPECNKPATFTKHTTETSEKIQRTYLKCGECGHEATTCYTDPDIRDMLDKQRELYAKDKKAAASDSPKIQNEMDRLRESIEGLA